ncbi:MAG: ATP-binding protein [Xanthomonadales bacterium]|nr:ATP-binding protein [Xanthomonadales bacterium]
MEQWNLSPRRILRVLFWLRNVSVVLQLLVFFLFSYWFTAMPQQTGLLLVVLTLGLFNILVHWRLQYRWPATEAEVAGHLLFDVVQFSVVLYFTGGASNPFVSLYLLPVALAAAALRLPFAVLVAGVSTVAYSALLALHQPGDMMGHHMAAPFNDNFNLHIWGMWLNFLLAAVLLILFVGMLAKIVRSHGREIATARERTLRDEGILAVGTLAAGAAHQLGTPLSTMKVLVEDWLDQECKDIPPADVHIVSQQVNACREILDQMLQQVRDSRGEAGHELSLDDFVDDCLERWRVTRPEVKIEHRAKAVAADATLDADAQVPVPIRYDVTLAQALTNLLNNAADASLSNGDDRVVLSSWQERGWFHCQIRDHGRGLSTDQAAAAQRMFRSSKSEGMGIGLALSNSTIERLHGTVSFHHDEHGGTIWVQVPLSALAPKQIHDDDIHHA